jgi:hypothetical protein
LLLLGAVEVVAVAGGQVESVDLLEPLDDLHGGIVEGGLLLEGVQHDPLEQVAQRQVEVLGEPLEDLQQAALHADAGLHTLNWYHGTTVHRLLKVDRSPHQRATGSVRLLSKPCGGLDGG